MTRIPPIALLLALCGCASPTAAVVAGYRLQAGQPVYLRCQVDALWVVRELVEHCGPPQSWLGLAGQPDIACAVYTTEVAYWDYHDEVPAFLVCFRQRGSNPGGLSTRKAAWLRFEGGEVIGLDQASQMEAIFPVRSLPPAATPASK